MNMPFSNITIPVDGSNTAQRGIMYAVALARSGTSLHFCSVVNTAAAGLGASICSPFDPLPVLEASEEHARRAWRDAVALAKRSDVAADGKIVFGAVAPAICRYAKEVGSDAIVIGTHARRGLSRIVFGSIAESLLATSDIPVVVTHADDAVRTRGPVTVAIDSSAPSRAALMLGIELALSWHVSLAIENVTGTDRDDWREATALLDDSAEAARAANVDFELVTVAGRAAETIVEGAERRQSSAIVVGTGARSAVARFLLGDVTAVVLERARIPVIAVPQR
ncbi:MAG TPA: universal stress protein [Candidatus Aquilonibacter sp.]